MKRPEEVRSRLESAWQRNWTSWLGGGGVWPLAIGLSPPTEAIARTHFPLFQDWVSAWRAGLGAGRVTWQRKDWRHLGSQDLPTHLVLEGPEDVAHLLGPATVQIWHSAMRRWNERVASWPDLVEPLRSVAGWLGALDAQDYARFIAAFDWLASHTDSGLYVRQLPIEGLDTKWVERHAGALARLLAVRLGRQPGALSTVAGLAVEPTRRRLRLLDPELRARLGGLSDIQAPIGEIAALELPVHTVLVIENQQTALACTDLPGSVLFMGGGFAVTELGQIPWMAGVPLLYWGDIDAAGFAILNALRRWHPHTASVMMDEPTLLSHRNLWSDDHGGGQADLQYLTTDERAFHANLVSGRFGSGVRLEQERLEWGQAWGTISKAVHLSRQMTRVGALVPHQGEPHKAGHNPKKDAGNSGD